MAAGTLTHGDRSGLERSPAGSRLPARRPRWARTALAAGVLALIGFFFIRLYGEARPLFAKIGVLDFIFTNEWVPSQGQFGALPLVVGTLITSAIALAIGVPVAVSAALFVTELCPRRL